MPVICKIHIVPKRICVIIPEHCLLELQRLPVIAYDYGAAIRKVDAACEAYLGKDSMNAWEEGREC